MFDDCQFFSELSSVHSTESPNLLMLMQTFNTIHDLYVAKDWQCWSQGLIQGWVPLRQVLH